MQHQLIIADQRPVTSRLYWLTLHAPDLARRVRPGQYVLARCAEEGSYDPLMRRPLFVAAAEEALGQIGLLYTPDDRGLRWLARGRSGDPLDIVGPLGRAFTFDRRNRNLLLIGQGRGLAALLLLARQAAVRGCAVTFIAGAAHADDLPPSFLMPGDVEYQSLLGSAIDLLRFTEQGDVKTGRQGDRETGRQGRSKSDKVSSATVSPPLPFSPSPLLGWADQIFVALPDDQIPLLRDAIRAARFKWQRGFAEALLEGPLVCGAGACGMCAVEMRQGVKMLCSDGPVFDMRDVGRAQ
jgi:dihydroorotate dehydrogenase electron transfer subunit